MPFSGNRADTARRSLAGSSPTIVAFSLRDPKGDDAPTAAAKSIRKTDRRQSRARIRAALIGLGLLLVWRPLWADEPEHKEDTHPGHRGDGAWAAADACAARITRAESRQLPGALADPFRAIEALPGVTPVASGLPYFFVRGAPPGNVGYFFDGIRLPLLFHVFFGPSVLHPSMIQKVDLYRGGYPAEYGRYAGAVVAADLDRPISNGAAKPRCASSMPARWWRRLSPTAREA